MAKRITKKKVQKFMKFDSIPIENQVYRFMNQFELEKLQILFLFY